MNAPTRPVLRWHGGKWKLAPWVISHFPKHRVYVEPFGGAASVLLRKERSYAEVYNDLDEEVVNLFEVLRSTDADRLVECLRLTPFARLEFERAYEISDDPIERARALVIRSYMGFGSDGHNPHNGRTGFRATSTRSGTTPAHDWAGFPDCMSAIIARFRGLVIECRNASVVMKKHDGPETLHYVDPPYVPETRSVGGKKGKDGLRVYAHELTREEHEALLGDLRSLAGMVVLSGYAHPLYEAALSDWRRVETAALADGARPRTEVLWLNPACAQALDRERCDLFARAAE
jgi:DNA adenine methylase